MIAWLRAQYDAYEAAARATGGRSWRAQPTDQSVYAERSAVVVRTDVPLDAPWSSEWVDPYVVPPQEEGGEGIAPADAEHIALHDPGIELADIAAKRAILAMHYETELESEPDHDPMGAGCAECGHFDWPCDTIKHLAAALSHRPGYREEWR